jgi:hypothetical protein
MTLPLVHGLQEHGHCVALSGHQPGCVLNQITVPAQLVLPTGSPLGLRNRTTGVLGLGVRCPAVHSQFPFESKYRCFGPSSDTVNRQLPLLFPPLDGTHAAA